jgi:3-oxoadipate enol-lactonase
MPFHEISPDVRINYTIHPAASTNTPSKPWVVLINGLADPDSTWAFQVPAFTSAGYAVLTYNNRGVGDSSRAPRDGELYTAELMASDLRSLVVALKVPTPYHVLGVSMGGMIGQQYALDYCLGNHELASLTLACTYAAPGPFCGRMFALWRDMAGRMSVADVMRDVTLWAFTREFFSDESKKGFLAEIDADMAKVDDEMGLRSYLAQLNVITEFDTRAEVGKLGKGAVKNVIVLAGEEDILIPVALSKELHSLIDGSAWRTSRGGHACMWEFPDEFNEACLAGFGEAEKEI